MKIAQITPIYPPETGGMGTVAYEYTQALIGSGHCVQVFTIATGKTADIQDSKVTRFRGVFSYGHAAIIPSFLWKLRGYDIIHLHYPFYGSDHFVPLAPLIWRTPLMITYHMKKKASGRLAFLFALHKLWQWFVFWRAKTVLVSSREYAASTGLTHSRLEEIPFWVDTQRFFPGDRLYARKRLGFSNEESILLFVGALDDAHYFKGLNVLLQSCAILRNERPWRLVIVGDGNRRSEYEKAAIDLGIADATTFVGFISDDKLPLYYQISDIHILPSIDRSEAFGLVTLEAAASAVPSIVSNLPGVRTLIFPGKTGLIVEPNNCVDLARALSKLIENPELVKQFGNNAQLMALDKFSKQVGTKKLLDIYKKIAV